MPSPKKPRKPRKPAQPKPATPQPDATTPAATTPPKPASAQDASPRHAQAHTSDKPAPMPAAEAKGVYLDELERTGQMAKAAWLTGHPLRYFQRMRRTDPAFALEERDALGAAPDIILSEVVRRAIEGVPSTLVTRFGLIEKTEYSDTLLLRLAERVETGSWRQRQQVETGSPGAFKTLADLEAAIANRETELAKARDAVAAERAREMSPDGDTTAEPSTAAKPAM